MLHFSLSLMNILNKTEFAIFISLFWFGCSRGIDFLPDFFYALTAIYWVLLPFIIPSKLARSQTIFLNVSFNIDRNALCERIIFSKRPQTPNGLSGVIKQPWASIYWRTIPDSLVSLTVIQLSIFTWLYVILFNYDPFPVCWYFEILQDIIMYTARGARALNY